MAAPKTKPPSPTAKQATVRADGWNNVYTGLGIAGKDKRQHTVMSMSELLDEITLDRLYVGDGLAKRIIDLPVHDMLREGFEIEGDTDNSMNEDFKRFKLMVAVEQALKWSRLHGGSVVVLGVDDGSTDLSLPVNEGNIRKIDFARVHNRWRTSIYATDVYQDPLNPKYGTPETYTINPISPWVVTSQYRVHESRLLVFDGEDVSEYLRIANKGWGVSSLQACYERIRGLSESFASIDTIVTEFVIGILQIKNLSNLMMAGKEKHITDRLNMIDMSKHIINSVLLDTDETYQKMASPVAGLEGLVNKLIQALSAATGIPVTLLMGESPAGLGATGASDIRFYYDTIASAQIVKLQPQLEKLCRYVMLSKESSFGGRELSNWKLKFKPLWQPTEKELADTRAVQASTDKAYIENGVLSPKEVRESRFGGDAYSYDTKLITGEEPDMHEPANPDDLKANEQVINGMGIDKTLAQAQTQSAKPKTKK